MGLYICQLQVLSSTLFYSPAIANLTCGLNLTACESSPELAALTAITNQRGGLVRLLASLTPGSFDDEAFRGLCQRYDQRPAARQTRPASGMNGTFSITGDMNGNGSEPGSVFGMVSSTLQLPSIMTDFVARQFAAVTLQGGSGTGGSKLQVRWRR